MKYRTNNPFRDWTVIHVLPVEASVSNWSAALRLAYNSLLIPMTVSFNKRGTLANVNLQPDSAGIVGTFLDARFFNNPQAVLTNMTSHLVPTS